MFLVISDGNIIMFRAPRRKNFDIRSPARHCNNGSREWVYCTWCVWSVLDKAKWLFTVNRNTVTGAHIILSVKLNTTLTSIFILIWQVYTYLQYPIHGRKLYISKCRGKSGEQLCILVKVRCGAWHGAARLWCGWEGEGRAKMHDKVHVPIGSEVIVDITWICECR